MMGFKIPIVFIKMGVDISLVPMDTCGVQEKETTLFMKRTDFEAVAKSSSFMFALVWQKRTNWVYKFQLQSKLWSKNLWISCLKRPHMDYH